MTWAAAAVCVAAALVVAAAYLWKVLATGPRLGFPLDDAYIYLTYAKQIARGHPFTYFDGGGFSAGATSMLWPIVLAPFWALGLRGHLFAWASFGLCAALLAVSSVLAYRIGRRTLGGAGGLCAAALLVTCAPLTWCYLSGMEVALAATLLLGCIAKLATEEPGDRPSRALLLLLAAAAVARPEMGLLIAAVTGARALGAAKRRSPRAALRWLSPLLAPAAAALATRALAGHFGPNTAVSKSHFYLPGFDWTYLVHTVGAQAGSLLHGLFWDEAKGPLGAPRLIAALWVIGAVRVIRWGARARRGTAAAMLVGGAPVLFLAVLVASGQWQFQNYRYIAAGLPPLLVVAGLGLTPPARSRVATWAGAALAAAALVWIGVRARPRLRADVRLYAQGARDSNAQSVAVGQWIDAHLPRDAYLAVHDVGAIGYYGNRRLFDVIGLVTNGQAEVCNNGPGARFEAFERMPPDRRPSYFAYYPGWLLTGSTDLFGDTLFRAALPKPLGRGPRLAGGGVMKVFTARWDLLGSGAAPLDAGGWRVVDAVDVADLVDERAHDYHADQGRRVLVSTTATWSNYFSTRSPRPIADGGRTVRGPAGERFVVRLDPARPARLLARFGGPATLPGSQVPRRPPPLTVEIDGRLAGRIQPPAPGPAFAEVGLEIHPRAGRVRVHVTSPAHYRIYHWFVLQP